MKDYNDHAALLSELLAIGYRLDTVGQLGGPQYPEYESAVSVLMEWFSNTRSEDLMGSIARVLARYGDRHEIKAALIREFENGGLDFADLPPEPSARAYRIQCVRDDLAGALRVAATPDDLDKYTRLVADPRWGRARAEIVVSLPKMRAPESTVPVLVDALEETEPHVVAASIDALGVMKASQAAGAVSRFLDSPDPYLRKAAAKALKRMGVEPTPQPAKPPHAQTTPPTTDLSGLHEVSSSFELDELDDLFRAVAALIDSGFDETDVAALGATAREMEPDAEIEFSYRVGFDGVDTTLVVRVFMDDVDSPDVYFFTSEALAREIDRVVESL